MRIKVPHGASSQVTARHPNANPSGLEDFRGPRRGKPIKVGSPNSTPVPERVVQPMMQAPGKMAAKFLPNPAKLVSKYDPL